MANDPPITQPAAAWVPAARPRRLLAPVAAAAAIVLLAAWTIPPMLDWSRFRTAIAAIAARNLGRPVVIGGEIRLRLLPEAVLTVSDVALADQGDGVSGRVAALRLQVAMLPLLTGRLALRDLVLSGPVLRLPMRLPGVLAHPSRPLVPHAFAARVEDGTLRIGRIEITGISAAIHGGPAVGSLREVLSPNAAPAAVFGAEGFAAAGGRTWRFTGALGAPDADGVSAVDLAVHGQGVAGTTDGTLQGTLADGLVQGRLRASGPDLSLLMPALPLPWTAEAPFVASSDRVDANAIAISLGGAAADGALALTLAEPARLDGRLHAASVDLDGWVGLLGRSFAPDGGAGRDAEMPVSAMLPVRIQLSAGSAKLLGGTVQNPHATLVWQAGQVGLDNAEAVLPGSAMLRTRQARFTRQHRLDDQGCRPGGNSPADNTPGRPADDAPKRPASDTAKRPANNAAKHPVGDTAERPAACLSTPVPQGDTPAGTPEGGKPVAGDALVLSGDAFLDAPDLPATLAWLRPLAPSLSDAAASARPRSATLSGTVTLTGTGASVAGLSGQVDGTEVSGDASVLLGTRQRAAATLVLDRLSLDQWSRLVAPRWEPAGSTPGFDSHLHLKVAHATWRGTELDGLVLDAATDAGLLRIDRAQAGLAGALVSLSGRAGPDGRVRGRAVASTADAACLLAALPEAWRWAPGLWHGPASVQLAADGPAEALGLQLRADIDDMVLEADARWDRRAGRSQATLTVRHPGAPRLLADLGILAALGEPAGGEAAFAWLDSGALTLRAHLLTSATQARVDDFDLDAAALRLSGWLQEDWSGAARLLSGQLVADQLALPGTLPDAGKLAALAAHAARLHLVAHRVTLGLRPVASDLSADLALGAGAFLADNVVAHVAGGRLQGQFAADLTRPVAAAHLQLHGATLGGPLTSWPVDLVAGQGELDANFDSVGTGWGGVSGSAHAMLDGAELAGFDLARFAQVAGLRTRLARGAAEAALSEGLSGGLSGALDAAVLDGRLTIGPSVLASAAGTVELSGKLELESGTLDLGLGVGAGTGELGAELGMDGNWRSGRVTRRKDLLLEARRQQKRGRTP